MIASQILVAYDSSALADRALQKAIQFASLSSASCIHIVHVYHTPAFAYEEDVRLIEKVRENALNEGKKVLEKAERAAKEAGALNVRTELLEGDSSQMLLHYAERESSDVIIMGSRGLSGLKELFLGSVSQTVVQGAKIPVFIVK